MPLVRPPSRHYHIGMEPKSIKFPLGALSSVQAETYGEPGQRTFRLVLQSGAARSYVWLEKEQLFQLGKYLQQAVQSLSAEDRERQSASEEPPWTGSEESIEFKARQLFLNYNPAANSFYLQALENEEDQEQDEASSVSCWVTVLQAGPLSDESLKICASGRPLCFLCSMPINPDGHVCPRANGHAVFESG